MKYVTPYERWGFSLAQWESLALLTARVEKAGIAVTGINNLQDNDPTAGAELIYSRGKQAIMLTVSSRSGKAVLSFHKNFDSAAPQRVCQGDLAAWDNLASQMIFFH
jgi:hypothetical protein